MTSFFLLVTALAGMALGSAPPGHMVAAPHRMLRRVASLTSPVDPQQTGTVPYCEFFTGGNEIVTA